MEISAELFRKAVLDGLIVQPPAKNRKVKDLNQIYGNVSKTFVIIKIDGTGIEFTLVPFAIIAKGADSDEYSALS